MCPDYDDFGNVIGIDRGGTAADMTYGYDLLHGWVKEITSTGGFEQRLYREDNTGTKLYNGSISAMTWKVPGQNYERRYDYTYDGMNRLIEGAYSHLPVFTPLPGIISSTGEEILAIGESSPQSLIPVIDGPGELVGPININAADQYTERIAYDKNSNITSLERYGMNNQRHYSLIDSLVITRNGNQLKTIEDHAEKHLTYTGASDFYDGYTYDTEYYYNANGALESDINRDIDLIQYDDLGNTRCIYYFEHDQIEYVYAADGTKLRIIHRPASSTALTDSIDYVGNLILKNGQPSMYLFDGGYATFNTNGAVNGWHYYIQDYMGNNRMVVNKNGTKEQITHYYPYGGVIGDISTNESLQAYKFEGKELDRTFGLDNYDIHARQYFAMMPTWDRIDPLAEKYYEISPYVYCAGNPVNLGDYNGNILQLLGDSIAISAAQNEIQSIVGQDYQVSISKDGIVSIPGIENHETVAGQKLSTIIEDPETTTINLVENSSTIFIGEAETATIDMADIDALGEGVAIDSHSAFMHELNEQFLIQVKGINVNAAHRSSRMLESRMKGGIIDASNFEPAGHLQVTVQQPGGLLHQAKILHTNGTIFKVERKIIGK